jgi:hypothetical protein
LLLKLNPKILSLAKVFQTRKGKRLSEKLA